MEVVAGVNNIDDEYNGEVRKKVRVASYHSEYVTTKFRFHDIAVLKVSCFYIDTRYRKNRKNNFSVNESAKHRMVTIVKLFFAIKLLVKIVQ